jgi:uncharacterized membrane protein
MATLTVWKFDNPTGAGEALGKLESLQKQQLIEIKDAAVVEWQPGETKPKTRQAVSLTGAGALGGAFWALFHPFLWHGRRRGLRWFGGAFQRLWH